MAAFVRERTLAARARASGSPPTTCPAWPGPTSGRVAFDQTTAGESAVAAALGALGSLDGKRVAIVGGGPIAEAAAASAAANGATPAAPGRRSTPPATSLLVAGKAGVLEHDLAATVQAKVVVPLTPVPVTARALAVLGRAGVVVVPDFLSTAARC